MAGRDLEDQRRAGAEASILIRPWAYLDLQDRETFRAAIVFLNKRLAEQGTVDWALRLQPGQRIERIALEDLLNGPSARELSEPWAAAWRLVEESWSNTNPGESDGTAVYGVQRRLRAGDRSGAVVAAIVNLVMPRLKVEPIEAWRWDHVKKPRKPKTVEDILSAGLTSGDLVDLGRQHLRGNILSFKTHKTRSVVTVELPQYVLGLIEITKTGDLHFIVTSHGKPFSKAGFGNWFGEAARKAGIQKNAHGVRKLAATIAADEGATAHELMSQFGWASPKQAEVYTRGADRAKLGIRSSKRVAERLKNGAPPNLEPGTPKHSRK